MNDLTVLVSPIPLYRAASSSSLASRRHRSPSPIMVTLESDAVLPTSENVARSAGPSLNPLLLSPPINTWKARARPSSRADRPRPRHRPTRSQSAPPTQTTFALAPDPPSPAASVDSFNLNLNLRKPPRRSHTDFAPGYAYVAEGMTLRGGELVRPPPPLLRPTTFWRRAHRSGVAAPSYSPSSHLIRRSTFIAAGLAFDAPMHDLSALGIESRITSEDGLWGGAVVNSPRVVEIPQAFELLTL